MKSFKKHQSNNRTSSEGYGGDTKRSGATNYTVETEGAYDENREINSQEYSELINTMNKQLGN